MLKNMFAPLTDWCIKCFNGFGTKNKHSDNLRL